MMMSGGMKLGADRLLLRAAAPGIDGSIKGVAWVRSLRKNVFTFLCVNS